MTDPVIANQSPPLTSLGHGPNENDLYQLGHDGSVLGDDPLNLHNFNWESKPMVALPMRPPMHDDHQQQQPPPVAFLDPASLTNGAPM